MRNSVADAKTKIRTPHRLAVVAGLAIFGTTGLLAGAAARAQDAVKVDPKHYKVEFENDQVRVLRITYGPHEKSVMHAHPASVAVFLTDGVTKMTSPDGKTQTEPSKSGATMYEGPVTHLPENMGDKPFQLILVELKTKPAAAK